jgi:hypothetical protein
MNRNQLKQADALTSKVLAWVDRIRTKQLTKTEAWLSLRMGITKALQYPLAAMQKHQRDSHQGSTASTGLPSIVPS